MACAEEWLAEGQRKPGILKCTAKGGGVGWLLKFLTFSESS